MAEPFRIDLPVEGRDVTVFGGHERAIRYTDSLCAAGARVTVVAPVVCAAIERLAASGAVTWRCRSYRPDDLDEPWIVVAVTGSGALDDRVASDAEAKHRVCVRPAPPASGTRPGLSTGEVVLVGGGPGDPGLLTCAGHRALQRADLVVTDRLAPRATLLDIPPEVQILDVGKSPRGHATPQDEINAILIDNAALGKTVVRLKGGDGFVFGRGGEELQACARAGVKVRVIPGVSSATAAPAGAGIPVTHRGLNQGFTVLSGHLPPGDPGSRIDFDAVARSGTDLVLLMAVENLPAITRALRISGLDPDTPAATIAQASLPAQHVVRATVATIAEAVADAGVEAPAVTLIGAVAGFDAGAGLSSLVAPRSIRPPNRGAPRERAT